MLKCVKINLFPVGNVDKPLMIIIIFAADRGERKARGTPLLFSQFICFQHFKPSVGSLYFCPERKTQKMNDICLCHPQEKVLVLSP